MATRKHIILLSFVLVFVLVGCAGGSFSYLAGEALPVDDALVVRQLRYSDEGNLGPEYQVSITVPDEWIGAFETTNIDNRLVFHYITESGRKAPIFTIEALSIQQFWEQNGSYPSDFLNLALNSDTAFVYNVQEEFTYSGLPSEQYYAFAEMVPDVLTSFEAEAITEEMMAAMAAN